MTGEGGRFRLVAGVGDNRSRLMRGYCEVRRASLNMEAQGMERAVLKYAVFAESDRHPSLL